MFEPSASLSWDEFLKEAKAFVEISEKLGDDWKLIQINSNEPNTYLSKTTKIQVNLGSANVSDETAQFENLEGDVDYKETVANTTELVSVEYHVIYSISYQVPVLYFRGHKSDGRPITLEDSWTIFTNYGVELKKQKIKEDMLSILTQTDHPILNKPFLLLHPCRTSKVLGNTRGSKNRIVTFLSVFGPYVKLFLCNNYATQFE